MARVHQARAITQYRRTSVFLGVPEDAELVFAGHVIFELGVDRRTGGSVEAARARNVDLCQKVARFHLEPPNDRLQLGVLVRSTTTRYLTWNQVPEQPCRVPLLRARAGQPEHPE